jgi:hypothetical protein
VPADMARHAAIVLSEEQSARLFEVQLADVLADELDAASGGELAPHRIPAQYRHVKAATAFVLHHGIEPFAVQRHLAAVTVETGGALLNDKQFVDRVESLRAAARWDELLMWRVI